MPAGRLGLLTGAGGVVARGVLGNGCDRGIVAGDAGRVAGTGEAGEPPGD